MRAARASPHSADRRNSYGTPGADRTPQDALPRSQRRTTCCPDLALAFSESCHPPRARARNTCPSWPSPHRARQTRPHAPNGALPVRAISVRRSPLCLPRRRSPDLAPSGPLPGAATVHLPSVSTTRNMAMIRGPRSSLCGDRRRPRTHAPLYCRTAHLARAGGGDFEAHTMLAECVPVWPASIAREDRP